VTRDRQNLAYGKLHGLRRLLLRALPAFTLASGVVVYLSLQAPVSRRDRIVILLILCAVYTLVLSALRMALLGARAIWAHVFGRPDRAVGPLFPWELYLGLSGLLVNLGLIAAGYKDVTVRESTWPMRLSEPMGILILGLVLAGIVPPFRRLPFLRWMEAPSWAPARNLVLGLLLVTLLVPDSAPPQAVNASALPTVTKVARPPLFIFGVDGADWQILRAALATGRLPHIQEMASKGKTSSLDNEGYGYSPPVWTSIITGQSRHQHQIYDFVTRRSILLERPLDAWWEKIPPGFGVKSVLNALTRIGVVDERVTDSRDRKGPSLWQVLSHFGYRSLVVNYLMARPPDEINGVFLAPGSPALEEAVAPLRTVSLADLRGVKKQVLVEYELAADEFTRSSTVTAGLLQAEPFDVVTFYASWPDWFNHLMSLEDYENVLAGRFDRGVPAALLLAYERMDAFVGELRGQMPQANILVISDHGVGPGYRFRRRKLQHLLGCPGIFIAQGPDVSGSGSVPPVSMYDIAPTVLAYYGLPLAGDLQGRARGDVLPSANNAAAAVASYNGAVANRRGASGSDDPESILRRLRALGYVQ
jgi:hypothetical protein